MLSVYRKLLDLYPAEHREQFGEEMIAVLLQERDENADRKLAARAWLALREIAGLMSGALRERIRVLFQFQYGLSLCDGRFSMRNGFRFPKTTIVFMALILACVVSAIQKGEDIAASLPHVNPQIGPIQPVHSTLFAPFVVLSIIFYGLGLAGWAVLFALRRSGVHRLADMSAEPK